MTRLLNALAAATLMMAESELRPTDAPVKRARNYDIEGPEPGPALPPEPLTRQQRRKLERQAAKRR